MLDTANFLSLIIHKSKSAYTCLINASGPRELFSTKFVCFFDVSTFQTLIFFFLYKFTYFTYYSIFGNVLKFLFKITNLFKFVEQNLHFF